MKRADYLAQPEVAGFVDWAGHLVRGEWGLAHSWKGKGPAFGCRTLYGAFERYLWPNSVNGDRFEDTVAKFDRFRETLNSTLPITSRDDQHNFILNARAVARWGGIRLTLDDWVRMTPSEMQEFLSDIKSKLDPACADTDALRGFRYMSSGYSKIYAALIPGLPIYDSRVACALVCLVRLYCQDASLPRVPALLKFGVPESRGNPGGRCKKPVLRHGQNEKYARDCVQFAWLMAGLTADPGEFGSLPENHRVDAIQSALFMLGYARLSDDAIVKARRS